MLRAGVSLKGWEAVKCGMMVAPSSPSACYRGRVKMRGMLIILLELGDWYRNSSCVARNRNRVEVVTFKKFMNSREVR